MEIANSQGSQEQNQDQNRNQNHQHDYRPQGNYLVCICGKRKLTLKKTSEELLVGHRDDGLKYTVRRHRKSWILPHNWIQFMNALGSKKSKLTAEVLIQTGARVNEARHIEERDIDYDRNTLKLRVVKTKARKKGEERGIPRTIPISTEFAKYLKKHFRMLPEGSRINLLSTSAFNIALKKALQDIKDPEWFMYSCHNIRKTHGNYLKILGDSGMMKVSMSEICLRLGHDMNTFLKDYGSSSVLNYEDMLLVKKILGDLYSGQR